MYLYYCTFGNNHRNADFVQPVYSHNEVEAALKMHEVHGHDWAFCYSEDEFNQIKSDGCFKNLIEFKPLYTEKTITAGEVKTWTDRLNQILGASQVNVNKRLNMLAEDFCNVYKSSADVDPIIKRLRKTILGYYAASFHN